MRLINSKIAIALISGIIILTSTNIKINAETSSDTQLEIDQLNLKITKINTDINDNQVKLKNTIANLNMETTSTEKMLREIQKNNSKSNFITILINSKNLNDFVNKTSAYVALTDAKTSKIDTLNRTKLDVQNQGIQLTQDIQSVQNAKAKLLEKYQTLKSKEDQIIAEKKAAQEVEAAKLKQTKAIETSNQKIPQNSNTPIQPTDIKSAQVIDMNQTSGTIDINAIAAYMSSVTGGDINTWTHIIQHESRGKINADNGSHYGLFQCDYNTVPPGSNVGKQIEGAIYKYFAQGFYNAWIRWEQ